MEMYNLFFDLHPHSPGNLLSACYCLCGFPWFQESRSGFLTLRDASIAFLSASPASTGFNVYSYAFHLLGVPQSGASHLYTSWPPARTGIQPSYIVCIAEPPAGSGFPHTQTRWPPALTGIHVDSNRNSGLPAQTGFSAGHSMASGTDRHPDSLHNMFDTGPPALAGFPRTHTRWPPA